jgi:hypothetical protein
MPQRRLPRPTVSGVLAGIALFVALGGTGLALKASSSIPDADGTFHACVAKKTGAVRLVATAAKCNGQERAVAWSGIGLSDAYVVHVWDGSRAFVRVPAGNYVVFGNCTAMETAPGDTANPPLAFGFSQAVLTSSEPPSSIYYHVIFTKSSVPNYGNQFVGRGIPGPVTYGHFGSASLAASGTFTLPKAGRITLTCEDGTQDPAAGHASYSDFSLTAIPVASLHRADVGGEQR